MHETEFAASFQPPVAKVFGVLMETYAIGHELALIREGNPLATYSEASFSELAQDAQKLALALAVKNVLRNALGLIGVSAPLTLGLLTAVLAWVPYVGSILGCLLVVLVAATDAAEEARVAALRGLGVVEYFDNADKHRAIKLGMLFAPSGAAMT